ncbi:hypothetical protein TrCOL_g13561, partial [Triparma columacea]
MSDREDLLTSILEQRDEKIAKLEAANAEHASNFAATALAVNELAAAVNDAANLVENAAGIVTVVNDLAVTLRAAADRAAAQKRATEYVETIEVAQRRAVVPKATEDYVDAPEVAAENTAAPEPVDDSAAALDGAMDDETGQTTSLKMKYQRLQAHEEMVGVLVERGAVKGIIEQSWDTKRANVGVVVHDEQELVLDYILSDCNSG